MILSFLKINTGNWAYFSSIPLLYHCTSQDVSDDPILAGIWPSCIRCAHVWEGLWRFASLSTFGWSAASYRCQWYCMQKPKKSLMRTRHLELFATSIGQMEKKRQVTNITCNYFLALLNLWSDWFFNWTLFHNMYARYNVTFTIMTYFLPISAMGFTYTRIGCELWGSQGIGECTEHQMDNIRSKRRVSAFFCFFGQGKNFGCRRHPIRSVTPL